jgi:hypothetical protein
MQVELNEIEMALCMFVASMRRITNRAMGVKDMTVNKNFMDSELTGVIGEFAFAKACNVFPRLIDRPKSGGEDCIYRRHRIDVKATRNPNNGVFVSRKNNDIDLYVLTHVEGNKVNILGWIESAAVTQERYSVGNGGYRYTGKLKTERIIEKVNT